MLQTQAGKAAPSGPPQTRPTRKWRWFAIGFLVVFIGMLALFEMNAMLPSGTGLMRCRLWQYYMIEMRGTFSMSNLGPASGNSSAAMMMAFVHILFSVIGGAVVMVLAGLICKTRP